MQGQSLLPTQGPYLPHTYYLGELRPTAKKSTSHALVDLHHALDESNANHGTDLSPSQTVMARPIHIGYD
jgi:hypothetical protein